MKSANDLLKICQRRILVARMRVINKYPFYGLLLMQIELRIDEKVGTAATDGKYMYFAPSFVDRISDSELDFIMMHEIMHVVLEHTYRTFDRDPEGFNIACDIVVNSNILKAMDMDVSAITLKNFSESMHRTPNGEEGYKYTAEEVYEMLKKKYGYSQNIDWNWSDDEDGDSDSKSDSKSKSGSNKSTSKSANGRTTIKGQPIDNHNLWGSREDEAEKETEEWRQKVAKVVDTLMSGNASGAGSIPGFAERMVNELKNPQTDWRVVLNDFIQIEINDYTLAPPDKRFTDSGFFLPDFNDADCSVKDLLFMVDTSGSMSQKQLTDAFSEIQGAISQFNGKIQGWLGFFDAQVVEPIPFSSEDEFKLIKAIGGGGTNFHCIFEYIDEKMSDKDIACVIIITDGYARYPDEEATRGVPVLWVINNEASNPPWGRTIRIK